MCQIDEQRVIDKMNRQAASRKSRRAGYVPEPQCDVNDYWGNRCPEKPTRDALVIKTNRVIHLCEQCFKNYESRGIVKAHNEKDQAETACR